MKTEVYIIIVLVIIIAFMIFLFFNKKRNYKKNMSILLNQCEIELNGYIEEVKKNFEKNIPDGELYIIKTFIELFGENSFNDFTVYHQLEYTKNGSSKRLDFFIVSPKGLFIMESKKWKGVTYIYRNEYQDLFNNTMFDSFGIGSNKSIRVFNVKKNDDNQHQLTLSSYANPIAQVRAYSFDLIGLLKEQSPDSGVSSIKNAVVFHSGNDYKVKIDNHSLESNIKIDDFTYVINDSHIKDFFLAHGDCGVDTVNINRLINDFLEDHRLQCNFKLDSENYMEAPFKMVTK